MAQIYDKPVRLLIHDMVSSFNLRPGDKFTRQDAIEWFSEHYPRIKRGTIGCHLSRLSTNDKNRLHHNAKPHEDDLLCYLGNGVYRLYNPEADPQPLWPQAHCEANAEIDKDEPADSEIESGSSEFPLERDLRNYLEKNLCVIEPGLRLYEDEELRGVEFPVGSRRIDLLAIDADGSFVVIELKVSRGYDRVVGQIARYMAWIRENLADPGQKVRGVIVARSITEDLILASSLIPDLQLYEYEMSLSVRRVCE